MCLARLTASAILAATSRLCSVCMFQVQVERAARVARVTADNTFDVMEISAAVLSGSMTRPESRSERLQKSWMNNFGGSPGGNVAAAGHVKVDAGGDADATEHTVDNLGCALRLSALVLDRVACHAHGVMNVHVPEEGSHPEQHNLEGLKHLLTEYGA